MSEKFVVSKRNDKYNIKYNDEENNPCVKEQKMTYKCLNENNYDHSKCENYFTNYTRCSEFWNKVAVDRRRNRIYPTLPPLNEREKIKLEYRQKNKI